MARQRPRRRGRAIDHIEGGVDPVTGEPIDDPALRLRPDRVRRRRRGRGLGRQPRHRRQRRGRRARASAPTARARRTRPTARATLYESTRSLRRQPDERHACSGSGTTPPTTCPGRRGLGRRRRADRGHGRPTAASGSPTRSTGSAPRRDGDPAHLTAIGHSYGSTTTGHAAHDHGIPVDDLVFVGSPGVGGDTNNAGDTGVDPRPRLGGRQQPRPDRLPRQPRLGPRRDAVRRRARRRPGRGRLRRQPVRGRVDHAAATRSASTSTRSYFDHDTESLYNISQIVNGNYDDVISTPTTSTTRGTPAPRTPSRTATRPRPSRRAVRTGRSVLPRSGPARWRCGSHVTLAGCDGKEDDVDPPRRPRARAAARRRARPATADAGSGRGHGARRPGQQRPPVTGRAASRRSRGLTATSATAPRPGSTSAGSRRGPTSTRSDRPSRRPASTVDAGRATRRADPGGDQGRRHARPQRARPTRATTCCSTRRRALRRRTRGRARRLADRRRARRPITSAERRLTARPRVLPGCGPSRILRCDRGCVAAYPPSPTRDEPARQRAWRTASSAVTWPSTSAPPTRWSTSAARACCSTSPAWSRSTPRPARSSPSATRPSG